jgi:hypothetical protein
MKTKQFYKASIYHCIDLEDSKEKHITNKGHRATFSFNEIAFYEDKDLLSLKNKIISLYGEDFEIDDNKLHLKIPVSQWSEKECPEYYEVYFEIINVQDLILYDLF